MRKAIFVSTVVAVLVAISVAPALSAGRAYHERGEFSDSYVVKANTYRCDFDLLETFEGFYTFMVLGDPPVFAINVSPYTVTHTNLDTGVSLTEQVAVVDLYRFEAWEWVEVGLLWHLRDPATGKLVTVEAGRATLDPDTEEFLTWTPNMSGDYNVLCEALGGGPAKARGGH
jgi:hypothetical protein